MGLLSAHQIRAGLLRLGEIAAANETELELLLLGGAVMALHYGTRHSTRDVDVVFLAPTELHRVRKWIAEVAEENDWPSDWMNDGAKGFLKGAALGELLIDEPGICVRAVAPQQLLAMKLAAWRDEVDFADAARLLLELAGEKDEIWRMIEGHLIAGSELKARYAFDDLWERTNGQP